MMRESKETIDIYELLDAIEKRPVLYLGSTSLTELRAFLSGYSFASSQLLHTPYDYIDFHEWVALRLGFYESTSGYVNMILSRECGEEEKGFNRFFELWHEFRERKSRVIYEAERNSRPYTISQRRLDTGEIEEMDANLIQIIKYTDDNAGFIKYVNGDGIIREKYVSDLDKVFWLVDAYGFEIDESAWRKVGD